MREGLGICDNATFHLLAHPAPRSDFGLMAAPKSCATYRLSQCSGPDAEDIICRSLDLLRRYPGLTGHNEVQFLFRLGPTAGHLHVEVSLDESGETLHERILTIPPAYVARRLSGCCAELV